MASSLALALAAVDPASPPAVATFDAIATQGTPSPDLQEHSMRVGRTSSLHRLTYYFDADTMGPGGASEVGRRFEAIAGALGAAAPPALREFVRGAAPSAGPVEQVVLGVEAARDSARCKYYLVLRADGAREVGAFLEATLTNAAPGLDASSVCIVGVDVGREGILDVKLYFRLDRARLHRVLGDRAQVADLARDCRDVVFQQCLRRPRRRQLYFHATRTASLHAWLAGHGYEAPLRRARSLCEQLPGRALEPWIVSFPYEDGRVDRGVATVYFHLGTPVSRP